MAMRDAAKTAPAKLPALYIDGQLYEGKLERKAILLALCRRLAAARVHVRSELPPLCKTLPECAKSPDCDHAKKPAAR